MRGTDCVSTEQLWCVTCLEGKTGAMELGAVIFDYTMYQLYEYSQYVSRIALSRRKIQSRRLDRLLSE